jgi:hypothetical protein
MFRRLLYFVLLACGLPVAAQKIEYFKVTPPVLEDRLHRAMDKTSDREQTLHELFESAGCKEAWLEEQKVKGSRTPNVVCTLKGSEESRVVVGAHYDKVENGHGIIDNWTGASLLPSLYEGLRDKPRRVTFVFIGFTDEEKGLVGSQYYVSRLTKDDKVKIRAMVNIDSLGLSDTKVWLSRADKDLARAAGGVAHALNLPLAAVNVDRAGESDSRPFLNAKIPVIDFHSATKETFSILHSPRDGFPAVHIQEYENSYFFLVAYLAYLDATLGADPPTSP